MRLIDPANKKKIIFMCHTEYHLFMAFILSVITYKDYEKTLILYYHTRAGGAFSPAKKSKIWDEVILVDKSTSISEDKISRIVSSANILHYFLWDSGIGNEIFQFFSKNNKTIILTEDGLGTYDPEYTFQLWSQRNPAYEALSQGYDFSLISEVWVCQPTLYSGPTVCLSRIPLEEFSILIKSDLNIRRQASDIFSLTDDSYVDDFDIVYFQQYRAGNSKEYFSQKMTEKVLFSIFHDNRLYIREHPSNFRKRQTLQQSLTSAPWELVALLSDLTQSSEKKRKIYISANSTAMHNSCVLYPTAIFIYIYKINCGYINIEHDFTDKFIVRLREFNPDIEIYVPSDWDELRIILQSISDRQDGRYNLSKMPNDIQGWRSFRRFGAQAECPDWTIPHWFIDRQPTSSRVIAIQALLKAQPDVGTLGVAIVTLGSTPDELQRTLDSLYAQYRLPDAIWVLGEINPEQQTLDAYVEQLGGDSCWPLTLSRRAVEAHAPDFIWILHAGDQLLPHSILTWGEYRLREPDPLLWYVDEAVLLDGAPANPMLKPDFNIDLLRAYPYIGHGLIVSSAAINAVGGVDPELEDLALLDMLWKLVERAGPPVVGHIPEVLLLGTQGLMDWVRSKPIIEKFPEVLRSHFMRMGVEASIESGRYPGLHQVIYPLNSQPLVSIIIPTRDQLPILQACIEGLIAHTRYKNYEILLVDNNSLDSDAVDFIKQVETINLQQVRVLHWPYPFNFSAMNNFAVKEARGEVLLFLNNDIQFDSHTDIEWLERLLAQVQRREVGAVGVRLDRADGQVDQAGWVLGMNDGVGAAFQGQPVDYQGYMNRMIVQQNVSMLSASCMMIRREVFWELEGFNAEDFPIYHGDADLCMRATQAGYLLVLEPSAGLLHVGGATRLLTKKFGLAITPDDEQNNRLYTKWLPQLARDSNYHPALSKRSPGFTLDADVSRLWEPLPGRPLPVVLASHANWQGSGQQRIILPFRALADELRIDGGLTFDSAHLMDVARIRPDVMVLQGVVGGEDVLTRIGRYQEMTGTRVVLEFDDYLPNVPARNPYRKKLTECIVENLRRTIDQVDWLVVPTPALAEEYGQFHNDIRVARNGLSPALWSGVSGARRVGRKIRVGCVCRPHHANDLSVIRSVVKALQDDVEWVFFGVNLVADRSEAELHPEVPFDRYPSALASLNLDLAVIPLEETQQNRCKSNLRVLELGACGVPVVCTAIDSQYNDLPIIQVRNSHQDWVDTIRHYLATPDDLAHQGDILREVVLRDWMLEGDFLDQWVDAWTP